MTETQTTPGLALQSIALNSGLHFCDVAVAVAAALSNIAGPRASIYGLGGEHIPPRLNLLVCGLDTPRWLHAQQLIMEPVESEQRTIREYSQSLSPKRLEQLQATRAHEHETDATLNWNFGPRCPPPSAGQRKYLAARQPTLLWRAWQPGAINETLDESPLIYSPGGDLVHSLHGKYPSEFIAALSGVDCELGPVTQLGRTRLLQAGVFASCREDDLASLIEDPRYELLWPHCLILKPQAGSGVQLQPAHIRAGYRAYQDAVEKLISGRRDGNGRVYEPYEPVKIQLFEFAKELNAFVDELPPWARPFFAHVHSLPYRLLWACSVVTAPGESDHWCLPFAIETTREIIHRQRDLLISWVDGANQAATDRARLTMLTKLADGPCLFRDLLRRYSVQKKNVHQPVLMALVNDGLVRLRDDGYLELTSAGRQLLAA